jgi:hypothetical protein
MGTHDTTSFFQEKVLAGSAYLQGSAYQARFGGNSGRWLVVTTGGVRLTHLMHLAQSVCTDTFWFTTLEQVKTANPLTAPIWRQGGEENPQALLT